MLLDMTARPRANLTRVLEDLGRTLLDLICGDPERADDIGGVVIHDPLDRPVLPRQALVLGIGVSGYDDVIELLTELGRHGAAGLIVRLPLPATEELSAAAEQSGVALLGLTRGASWAQLATMLRSLVAEGELNDSDLETLGGIPSGDLFAVANAIAALLDAPVTIEDRTHRVMAFSGRQDEADEARVETILGRHAPTRFIQRFSDEGIFGTLFRSDEPVFIEPAEGEGASGLQVPRTAIAVRAGDEILGSIWAATRSPLSAERSQAFRDAARIVALHMLQLRAGADVGRRLQADLVSTALEGGPAASEALDRLGLRNKHAVILALAPREAPDAQHAGGKPADLAADHSRLTDAFAMHLAAMYPGGTAASVGDVVYGILPTPGGPADADSRAARVAKDFLERVGTRHQMVVGIGAVAEDGPALARSRQGADRALRALRAQNGPGAVARIADVYLAALLLDLGDIVNARGDLPTGPVVRLMSYDTKHRGDLVETLRTWLDSFGDINAAATLMNVHPNTFRYRLRRVTKVGQIDQGDADARLAAELELRLFTSRRPQHDREDR